MDRVIGDASGRRAREVGGRGTSRQDPALSAFRAARPPPVDQDERDSVRGSRWAWRWLLVSRSSRGRSPCSGARLVVGVDVDALAAFGHRILEGGQRGIQPGQWPFERIG
jgi:hypothetical protein